MSTVLTMATLQSRSEYELNNPLRQAQYDLAHIAMVNLDQKMHRALQPIVQAPDNSGLDDHTVVQSPQRCIFKPAHQKPSRGTVGR